MNYDEYMITDRYNTSMIISNSNIMQFSVVVVMVLGGDDDNVGESYDRTSRV